MDLGTVAWLDSAAGREVLADATARDDAAHSRAAEGDAGAVDPLRAATDLRRAHPTLDAALAGEVLTQVRLRRRARGRLGDDVDRLLLTPDGAEQATRADAARLRAARLTAAGATHVADLGCGLGLDSLALTRAGLRVTAAERDPVTAALARANAAALGLDVTVVVGDVTDPEVLDRALAGADAAYVDPARRDLGSRRDGRAARVSDPQEWSPPWSWVEGLAARMPRTAAKVAPGVPHGLTPAGGCATWTSVDGQLVEAELAWPALVPDGVRRRAVVVRHGSATAVEAGDRLEDETPPPVGPVGTWLHEPDDALIRAGLVGEVARRLDGRLLDARVAYVTTDSDVDPGPLTARFRVLASMPYDLASLRAVLVSHGVGHVVVKKRAIGVDPDDVRRSLRLPSAGGRAVVVLTRVGDDATALVCQA